MKEGQPQAIYLKDYTPPAFLITHVKLDFNLGEESVLVTSQLKVFRNPKSFDETTTLILDGEDLKLNYIEIGGKRLTAEDFLVSSEALHIFNVQDQFDLSIQTEIYPQKNTSLEGLYKSNGMFCTQCEAQGFRKITYFLDRPDVMAKYRVRIQAAVKNFPVLLSNGNLIEQGTCDRQQHFVIWQDPYPKPCYLFALVAGDLAMVEESYTTRSKREIILRIFTEAHNKDRCAHALNSLKKAMWWDEQRFGLECDLDMYMIVAVDDFNMGAMENKGLNIFNSSCVLARPDTATDADYMNIEAIVAHEYFHNWTGNRVTCRDWFQLSLKEGLTVFRDQEFTADVTSRAVKRINDVRDLRSYQFAEDASPMAHPVRPASYVEINNFYTLTVYEKGAEIVRMYQTMFGVDGFRKGMDLYFERHDGQAVTTDDFAAAIADANQADLTQFKRWYSQAGTPKLEVTDHWDRDTQTYEITFSQFCPTTPDTEHPFVIPVKLSLLDMQGEPYTFENSNASSVLMVTQQQQTFTFENIPATPTPDLLQEFSAPVQLEYAYNDKHLAFLLVHSPDSFNRWNAGNKLAVNVLLREINHTGQQELSTSANTLLTALKGAVQQHEAERSLLAELLSLPNEKDMEEHVDKINMHHIISACDSLKTIVAQNLEQRLLELYLQCKSKAAYQYTAEEVARRRLQNVCLTLLTHLQKQEHTALAYEQFKHATNMTEQVGAINALLHFESDEREQVLKSFAQQWQNDSLVMDKWLAFHARSKVPKALEIIKELMQHPVFSISNPNKVRSLIGVFAGQNSLAFHHESGSGYSFLADQVIALDHMNPQVASRLARSLMRWNHYVQPYADLMREQLQRIIQCKNLSKDVYEIVSKSLASND